MKLISSTFNKRLVLAAPILGLSGFSMAVILPHLQNGKAVPDGEMFFPLIVAGVMGFFFWKFFSGLADQVWDDGNSLLVKIRGQELRINLGDIVNINYITASNPPRAVITLRNETQVGKEIAFIPKRSFSFNPFAKNEIIEDLIARVDIQRRR